MGKIFEALQMAQGKIEAPPAESVEPSAQANRKKPDPGRTRKKTVGRFIIIFIVCGWMFVLGVLVGRGTAPVHFDVKNMKKNLTGELTSAIEKEKEKEKAQVDVSTGQTDSSGKQDLGFYEDLNNTKELPENINVKTTRERDAVPSPSPQKTDTPAKESASLKTEEKVIKSEPSLPKKVTGPVFTIQVASSKDPKYADKMVGELAKKGYQAYKSSGEIKGKGIWHRIRIGEYSDRAGAETVLARLKKDKLNGIIVTK